MRHNETIGFEIRRLDNMLMRNMLYCVRQLGLDEVTVMNGWILGYLCDNPDRDIFQRDIETEFSIGRSTVTNIVKLMEKKGMLCRESVPEDARLKKLVLTEKGRETDKIGKSVVDRLEEHLTRGISQEELDTFLSVLNKLKENLEQQKEEMKCLRP